MIIEAKPPGHAFPGGAWEREVWHDWQLKTYFETGKMPVPLSTINYFLEIALV